MLNFYIYIVIHTECNKKKKINEQEKRNVSFRAFKLDLYNVKQYSNGNESVHTLTTVG